MCHYKNIGGFEIAVKDPDIVRGIDAVGDLPQKPDRALYRQRSLAAQKPVKRFALDVFHDEIKNAVGALAEIRNADRIRMLDRSRRLGLALKAGDRLAFLQVLAAQDILPDRFYRNFTGGKFLVPRQVNLSHRPAAQPFFKEITVGEKLRAGQRRPCLGLVVRAKIHVIRKTELALGTFFHLV